MSAAIMKYRHRIEFAAFFAVNITSTDTVNDASKNAFRSFLLYFTGILWKVDFSTLLLCQINGTCFYDVNDCENHQDLLYSSHSKEAT